MKKLIILIINSYQYLISPLLPPTCKFFPTCSSFGKEAVNKYGAIKGGWLTIKRLLRCNPWNEGGYDPVP